MIGNVPGGDEKLMLDTTGAFHWCPNQTLEKCTLDGEQVEKINNFASSQSFSGFKEELPQPRDRRRDCGQGQLRVGLEEPDHALESFEHQVGVKETESHTWTSNCYSY